MALGSSKASVARGEPPVITSVSPDSGLVRSIVRIRGRHLGDVDEILFRSRTGFAYSGFQIRSDSVLVAWAPKDLCPGPVLVSCPAGVARSPKRFELAETIPPEAAYEGDGVPLLAPRLDLVRDYRGEPGDTIRVAGARFFDPLVVTIDGVIASHTLEDSTRLSVVIPDCTTSGSIQVRTVWGISPGDTPFEVLPRGYRSRLPREYGIKALYR